MPRVFLMGIAFLLAGTFFLGACGDSKTLSLSYTLAANSVAPDFAVVMSMDLNGNFGQNIFPCTGSSLHFYDDAASLKRCAVALPNNIDPNGLIPSTPAPAIADCQTLASTIVHKIADTCTPKGLGAQSDPLSNQAFSLLDSSSGYVFVLFSFKNQHGNPYGCFNLFGSKIANKKFVDATGTSTESKTVSVDSNTNCFSY